MFTARRSRCSRWRRTTGRRKCSPWWTDSSGTHRGRRNHLCHRSCNRCSLSRVAWATRCDRSRDASTLLDRHRALDRPRIRINRAPFRPRDYSRTKCFSCGQLGHTQVRCPKPDSSLPFRPSGWVDRSDGPQRNSGGPPQGNEI